MQYFFDTENTIPKGLGFSNFDSSHLMWLAISVLSVLFFSLQYRSLSLVGRAKWRKTVALLIVFDEVFKQACMLIGGTFLPKYLPLHLCNANIFLIAIRAWKPNQTIGNFLYVLGIPGAIAALLFPAWNKLPFLNFMYLHSYTVHILLILYPVALLAAGEIRPDVRQIPKCLALLAGMASIAQVFNLIFDTNFFYLMRSGGKNNPFYWVEVHMGSHLYGVVLFVAGMFALMYIPIELRKKYYDKHQLKHSHG